MDSLSRQYSVACTREGVRSDATPHGPSAPKGITLTPSSRVYP